MFEGLFNKMAHIKGKQAAISCPEFNVTVEKGKVHLTDEARQGTRQEFEIDIYLNPDDVALLQGNKTFSALVTGLAEVKAVVAELFDNHCWFAIEPWCDEDYYITVKEEAGRVLSTILAKRKIRRGE
jgi:hypothetical protein